MKEHVHHRNTSGLSNELLTTEYIFFELLLLISIERKVFEDIVVSFEEESACTRTRIMDRRLDTWSHHFNHCSDEYTRSEVLTSTRLHIFGYSSEERLIDLTLFP